MNSGTLQIIEVFRSVQGETSFAGLPTTFIRLAACNLRCSWCDTSYSFGKGETRAIEDILRIVKENGCQHVCVTGGEPLLQPNVQSMMTQLCDQGYVVSLETSGSLPTEGVDPRVHVILDVKCPGSGMEKKNLWANLELLRPHDEVKFVISDEADYLYAKEVCDQNQLYKKVKNVLFSPVFGQLDAQKLVYWILNDQLPVRLNMQIHKFIWEPMTKGV